MTLADDLERGWQTLEAGDARDDLRRSLLDLGMKDERMMLAIEGGHRELLFAAPKDFTLGKLKPTRGLEVAVRTYGTGSGAQRFLVIRCTSSSFFAVFRRFAAAVVEDVSAAEEPCQAALDAIHEWRTMFDRAADRSKEALLGIYGELDELRRLTRWKRDAVVAWTGPFGRPQDFINSGRALEVKSVKAFPTEVEIHGIEQLWARPLEELVLVVKQVVLDAGGERLEDVVRALLEAGTSADALYERCETLGLDAETLASLSTPRFVYRGSRYLRVTADAPALTPDHLREPLSPEIRQLRYRVPVSASGFVEMGTAEVEQFLERLCG